MSRPRKYHTEAERRAARRAQTNASKIRKKRRENPDFEEIVHVPIEVLMERDFRSALPGSPPALYAAKYYQQAWQLQRRFACTIG